MRSLTLGTVVALVALPVLVFAACDVETGEADSSNPLPVPDSLSPSSGVGGSGGDATGGGGASSSASTGSVMPGSCDGPGPVVETAGAVTRILLKGTVLTPTGAIGGEVLIENNALTCVGPTCSAEPGAAGATVIQTNGIISPGLIDGHNHILFDIFNEDDWSPSQVYTNHDQWPNEASYGEMVDAKQYLNGESGSPVNVNCEMLKYGELKALIAGTTSVVGAANPTNKTCYRTLARTIDQSANGLCGGYPPGTCPDGVQVATLFPSTSAADGVCANFADGSTDAYVIHIAEGVDQTSLNEFNNLFTVSTTDGCLYHPNTTIVHGTALGDPQFETMATFGMGLVWSPRSNVFLYGAGTDLTKTTDVPLAISKGITVALAPDWSMGGSQNLLDELRFADFVDDNQWGDTLTSEELVAMVTTAPAELLGLESQIGSLAPGMLADITVIGGDVSSPYDAILAATPEHVRLSIVGGVVLYGDDQLAPLGPQSPGCEALDACGRAKFVCVATNGGTGTNLFGQTLAEIVTNLSTEIAAYDALNLTQWDFAPIVPLVKCGP